MSKTHGNSSSKKEDQLSKPSEKAETNKPEIKTEPFDPKTAFKPEEAYTSDFTEDRSKIVTFDSNEDS
ncbi:MAG: hypothetical protein ABI417_02985 [Coleofasciculaceae cyanobacterium]